MILHRPLAYTIIKCLQLIFNEGEYADKVVNNLFKTDKRLGSKDRKLLAEAIYEIVRWKRLYAAIAGLGYEEQFAEKQLWLLIHVWLVIKGHPVPVWEQFNILREADINESFQTSQKTRVLRESIPDWLDALGVEALGVEKWEKEIAAQNRTAFGILRVNTLKTSKSDLQNELSKQNIETSITKLFPDALILNQRSNVFLTDAYNKGYFEMQDASSQLVAPFMEVQPGMRVVDACAGAGGKTLHLATIMQNKGQLIALDIHAHKLEKLKIRAKRNGIHNIDCRPILNTKVIKKLHYSADRLLIDAPCSGLGVLRRNPDDKWKLTPEFITKIMETQREILRDYSKIVKPGGKLVYATCSILPSENQDQIRQFLASEEGRFFEFEDEKSILASESGFDGFYMARLQRKLS
ncbi:MAG: class I SAM-dependent methyltransferase [Saprospiraceae bacterium]|nr:class I SAM-dependent methyltransferase [Saprospiraceae bacterium]